MQGVIVVDNWALVELLRYHTKLENRPALFLSASLDVELFLLFQAAFKELLQHSKAILGRVCLTMTEISTMLSGLPGANTG